LQRKPVTLSIPFDVAMIPVVTGFVENSGGAFGLGKRECLSLTLAAEEVFAFIAATGDPDREIQIICHNYGYYVEMAFQLKSGILPLETFNLTLNPTVDKAEDVDRLGLILASRTVDRLAVDRVGKDTFILRFIMDKRYPVPEPVILPEPNGRFQVREADYATISELSMRILSGYADSAVSFLKIPGKLLDMVKSGDYEALVALNEKGQVGGGVVFGKNLQMSEAYGPFVFTGDDRIPQMLAEMMIEKLGRTKDTVCLTIMAPTPQTPLDYFERLPGGAVYRQLLEDDGARVFAHPLIKSFLNGFYQDLALPRMIQDVAHMGEELAQHSAIAAAIDRQGRKSELTLLSAGQNLEENLRAHLKLLQTQEIGEISYWMRLGAAEEVIMAPQVLAAGFEPVMVLPWARQGDVAVFRYRGRA
jgi:hypothetical protein